MQIARNRKFIAVFFLLIFSVQLLMPLTSYALTDGPSQPEMAKFVPAGTSDLVDLFTGDMKYNIPLLDVGGYPINLSYQSGSDMEDEASWVGSGWTLNPGAVNRTMRGLPDDFDGSLGDKIDKEYTRKEFKKIGAQLVVKPSLFGWEKGSASVKLNVYKDNYYGIGASVGASVNFNLVKNSSGTLTAGLNIDVNSDVRDGVNISPTLSLKRSYDDMEDASTKWNLAGGFNYNTRGGLKSVSLGASYNTRKYANNLPANIDQSAVKYFGQSYTPQIKNNTSNSGFTFSFDLGPTFFGGHIGLGGSGYFYREKIKESLSSVPAFGYMNYTKGRKNEGVMLDYNRERDGIFLKSAPAIPIPVATHDFFVATGQTGSQQFRPHFGGNYTVFDKIHSNTSNNSTVGLTAALGNLFLVGGRVDLTNGTSTTKKWVKNNTYLDKAEAPVNTAMDAEPVYFKQVGEQTTTDNDFYDKFGNTTTAKVPLAGAFTGAAYLNTRDNTVPLQNIVKTNREKRNYGFSYLTNKQAMDYSLNKKIANIVRNADDYRKDHHIGAITVTDNAGKRMIYDIPVYNRLQEEVTFSVQKPSTPELIKARRNGLVSYSATDASSANKNGRDQLYTKDKTPGYATSYLLTGILSPDYVDQTGDGISEDDLGTAVKFNYARHTNEYQWRAPYLQNMANYNEGFISDPKDDKASYAYGKKEIWYLQSVESKTMIAIFETSDREDGLGVLGNAGGMNTSLKLKKLDRVKLYAKADWLKNANNATPVKIVYLEYDYSLYPDVQNNSGAALWVPDPSNPQTNINLNAAKGKLTLRKVYSTFGEGTRGKSNPYEFFYENTVLANDGTIAGISQPVPGSLDPTDPLKLERDEKYTERQSDRWGTYKPSWYNHLTGPSNLTSTMNNSEFPYSLQKNAPPPGASQADWSAFIDRLASKWQLSKIVTPSSGIITIDYESDDYAFVQNRKAMQMCFVKGINTIAPSNQDVVTGLINKNKEGIKKLVVDLPVAVANTDDFKKWYMTEADGRLMDKMFYKVYADLNHQNKYDYVYGYVAINWAQTSALGNTAYIAINEEGSYNGIVKGAWQTLRTDLPQFAYDGYDNSDADNLFDDVIATLRSIVQAVRNFKEIFHQFEERADTRWYADQINKTKSMVRLATPPDARMGTLPNPKAKTAKTGGGCRVKKVQITDEWAAMTSGAGGNTAKYGQVYDYTIKQKDGSLISSGVAAYEPSIGNEENPFHEPINFTEKVAWTSDRYHYIEKPFCETYFPAAAVGYSKVKVTAFGDDYTGGPTDIPHTGYIENEFYTAKDFPTLVDNLTLDQSPYENGLILHLFSSVSYNRLSTSQGFKVELNDMHGKTKSASIFNKGGDLISSTKYSYRVKDPNAEVLELDNDDVDLLEYGTTSNNGAISKGTIATDIDFTTDVRESKNESIGKSVGAYVGVMIIPFFIPMPVHYGGATRNLSISMEKYNSVSAVKVVNRFGIVSKVVTTQNGSTIEAENLLWDGLTGEVLLTRTQNEFDKSTYAFNYPAYMVNEYEGMGGAYKNLGITFTNFVTDADGLITSLSTNDQQKYLFPGDELVSLGTTKKKGWIVKSLNNAYRLMDENGDFIAASGSWLLLRSGRRNILNAGVGSVVTMIDPRVEGTIVLDVDKRILDSRAVELKNEWAIPVNEVFDEVKGCLNPINKKVNPYYKGLFGNWRPLMNHVYTVAREQKPGNINQNGGTDIRNSGYYKTYNPFWSFQSGNSLAKNSTVDDRWVWSSKSVYYDQKGNEIESVDALSRYGAALFGYSQSLVTAVGANSRHNEIVFDGFEDYDFKLLNDPPPQFCPPEGHFNFGFVFNQSGGYWETAVGKISALKSHTGKYSYELNGTTSITKPAGNAGPPSLTWTPDPATGKYLLPHNELAKGFAPVNGKKYLFSCWIDDGSPFTNTLDGVTVTVNGQSASAVTVVEGWKRIEIPFTASANFNMVITGTNKYVDDIRVLPFDGQMNSYVYDSRTMRLMAQLDENNFATLYEYDDEGTPVRVKKETEKGILTLKENRQSLRKRN